MTRVIVRLPAAQCDVVQHLALWNPASPRTGKPTPLDHERFRIQRVGQHRLVA
jgi:hypothetical protein